MEDLLTVAPFQNTIDIVELEGRHVRAMFEHSVQTYDPMGLDPSGGFLQVSGRSAHKNRVMYKMFKYSP